MSEQISFPVKLQKACGIDLHKDSIFACFMDINGSVEKLKYGAFTKDLLLISQELQKRSITEVVIESTGIYWVPLYDLLTSKGINVLIANPLKVKQIPGKKTDMSDCEWLCKLLMSGLVTASFIPKGPMRQLRELNRQRSRYTSSLSQVKNRILKVLEAANIKLRSVVSQIDTLTARDIVQEMANGVTDIVYLQSLCRGRAKKKAPMLVEALQGTLTDNQRMLLQLLLEDWKYTQERKELLEKFMQQIIDTNYEQSATLLRQIPGIGQQSAMIILAELGEDLSSFDSADKLTKWAGLAPGNRQSAGKWYNQHVTKGNSHLRPILIQAAWAMVRKKGGYWEAQFKWLKKRLPAKKAIVAIARKLLKLIYRVLTKRYKYEEKGGEYFYIQRNKFAPVKKIVAE